MQRHEPSWQVAKSALSDCETRYTDPSRSSRFRASSVASCKDAMRRRESTKRERKHRDWDGWLTGLTVVVRRMLSNVITARAGSFICQTNTQKNNQESEAREDLRLREAFTGL